MDMDIEERRHRLGKRIKTARESRGISQRSFALMIGISQPYLSGVENGDISIGFNNLCKIADGLDMELVDLVQ